MSPGPLPHFWLSVNRNGPLTSLGHGARGEDGEDGEDVAIGFLEARVAPWLFQWIGLKDHLLV